MNTGQMLLVLGALILFSTLLPSMNRSLLYNDRTLIATNAEMAAISLANKILAEADIMAYDEICLSKQISTPNQLTSISDLGPESGEKYPNFDDVDDFHNVTIADSVTLPSVLLNITGKVTYADPKDPSKDKSARTLIKRLIVEVTSPYLINPASEDTVRIMMEQLYTYY